MTQLNRDETISAHNKPTLCALPFLNSLFDEIAVLVLRIRRELAASFEGGVYSSDEFVSVSTAYEENRFLSFERIENQPSTS